MLSSNNNNMKLSTVRRAFFCWYWLAAFVIISYPSHGANAVAPEVAGGNPSQQSHFGPSSPRKLKETKTSTFSKATFAKFFVDSPSAAKSAKSETANRPPGNFKEPKSSKKDPEVTKAYRFTFTPPSAKTAKSLSGNRKRTKSSKKNSKVTKAYSFDGQPPTILQEVIANQMFRQAMAMKSTHGMCLL